MKTLSTEILPLAKKIIFVGLLCLLVLGLGCASAPKQGGQPASGSSASRDTKQAGMTKEAILKHDDVKGQSPAVFAHPIDQVREAGLRALTFVGCEIKKREPYYLSGRRPNKFGLFVGSGGETVEIFLYPQSDAQTQVWVDTDLSFVGMAGQQGWNDQVLKEIANVLSKTGAGQ